MNYNFEIYTDISGINTKKTGEVKVATYGNNIKTNFSDSQNPAIRFLRILRNDLGCGTNVSAYSLNIDNQNVTITKRTTDGVTLESANGRACSRLTLQFNFLQVNISTIRCIIENTIVNTHEYNDLAIKYIKNNVPTKLDDISKDSFNTPRPPSALYKSTDSDTFLLIGENISSELISLIIKHKKKQVKNAILFHCDVQSTVTEKIIGQFRMSEEPINNKSINKTEKNHSNDLLKTGLSATESAINTHLKIIQTLQVNNDSRSIFHLSSTPSISEKEMRKILDKSINTLAKLSRLHSFYLTELIPDLADIDLED